jgi:hypothetical protein
MAKEIVIATYFQKVNQLTCENKQYKSLGDTLGEHLQNLELLGGNSLN